MGAGPPGARAWIIAAPTLLPLRLRWPLVRAPAVVVVASDDCVALAGSAAGHGC